MKACSPCITLKICPWSYPTINNPKTKTKARTTIAKIGVLLKDIVVSLLFNTYPQIEKTYLSYGRIKTEIRLNEKD
tara:strand:+ start:391 stop:618 length:228 start_codon:yes stop_codon:yes gene_type:complete